MPAGVHQRHLVVGGQLVETLADGRFGVVAVLELSERQRDLRCDIGRIVPVGDRRDRVVESSSRDLAFEVLGDGLADFELGVGVSAHVRFPS